MRINALLAVLAFAFSCSAHADGFSVKPLLQVGITAGGEDVFEDLEYDNGDNASPSSGGLFQFGAGLEFQFGTTPWSAVTTINYHFDKTNASNGDSTFDRVPLELLGYYSFSDAFKLGLGARYSMNTSADVRDDYDDVEVEFKDSLGLIVEGVYQFTRNWAVAGRIVFEEYESETFTLNGVSGPSNGRTLNGTHGGVFARFVF